MSSPGGCAPPPFTPPTPPVSDAITAPGGTIMIEDPGNIQVWSANRETDARTALARGLAEYLRGQTIDFNGDRYQFRKVLQTYGEPEEAAEYPSAVVYARGAGEYDPTSFTPKIDRRDRVPEPDGRFILTASELVQELIVEIWTNSPEERQALVALVEDAMVPVDWRYGPLLELPHYHNARASYEKLSMSYDDSEIDAMRRYRKATFIIRGKVPVVRVVRFATFDAKRPVRLDIEVEEPGNPC